MFLKIGLENNQLNTVFFYSQNVSPVEPEMFGTAIAKIENVSSSFLTWVIMTFPNILAPFKFNVTFTISAILAGNESIILSL